MKKIPTLFKRDYSTRLVVDEVTPGCEWVLNGEGVATRKWDGTCCMIRDGKLYKRYDAKKGKPYPVDFEPCEKTPDPMTGHWPGWVPIGDGPEDKYHREAFQWLQDCMMHFDGTYELCGPKINGNPEGFDKHKLIRHGVESYIFHQICYHQLLSYLKLNSDIEGIVFHHPDGRMCKIKAKDFGLKRA